jgi:predicted ATPase/DNA-binding CsgD family transcriptional regulator/transcriptional regulator with XRE-family HTH domain
VVGMSGDTPSGEPRPFGVLLRGHRVTAGLSQSELAERAGLSARAISDLERGARRFPYATTVRRLARALRLRRFERSALLEAGARDRVSGVDALEEMFTPAAMFAHAPGGSETGVGLRLLPTRLASNFPLSMSTFVGRDRELSQVRALLTTNRLLTLTGPGGMGKTRLAVEIARDLASAKAPAVFVDLAPLADPELVPPAIAASLGVREQPGRPLRETLMRAIGTRGLLLVLDNCEHLLAAAARLAESLLLGCPRLQILATSREALKLPGELAWPTPGLSIGEMNEPASLASLLQSEAVRLFVDRAVAARRGFALTEQNCPAVGRICRRLDGIPLAIELAAARTNVLSAEQIAQRLDEGQLRLMGGSRTAPLRHQTLAATIEWSYDLLQPAERMLFDSLSVFAGGWTLDAAEAICAGALGGQWRLEMLDRLTRLVDASLVVAEEHDRAVRYRQLDTLRAYASERLQASDPAEAVRACHATYYLELAEPLAQQSDGPQHSGWMQVVEKEFDNLRAALNWLADHDAARALRLAVAIERYWYLRGFITEGCHWLEDLLTRVPASGKSWGRAALGLADLLTLRHDNPRACQYAERSMDVLRAAGDLGGTARAARFLGLRALHNGDLGQARTLCQTSLVLARQAGDQRQTVVSLDNLGLLAIAEQDLPEATRRFEEGLALARSIGYRFGDVSAVARLGVIARLQGDYRRARTLIEEGLAFAEAFGHRPAACSFLTSLGNLARCEGDYAEARRLLLQSLESGQRDVGLPLVLLNAVGSLGVLAVAQQAYGHGVRLLSAVSAAGAPHGTVQVPELRYDSAAALASARAALGESAYAAAWAEGQTWTLEVAVSQSVLPAERSPALSTGGSINAHEDAPTLASGQNAAGAHPSLTLTPRQREIATLVAQGRTNRQIGEVLVITEGTARVHVEHILTKLGLHSRVQLATWALERGLFTRSN